MTDPTASRSQNGFQMYQPTISERLWRALGFELCPLMPQVEDRLGYAPGHITIITTVRLSFADRLRVLITGHIGLGQAVQTDVEVRGACTTVRTVVMAPGK